MASLQNSPLPYVHFEGYIIYMADHLQVISPFALAAALFSMPESVIPFEMNTQSFVIAILVITVVLRLMFIVFGALLHRLRRINLGLKPEPFGEMAFGLSTFERFGWFLLRRGIINRPGDEEKGASES